jgi:hypothetical protein
LAIRHSYVAEIARRDDFNKCLSVTYADGRLRMRDGSNHAEIVRPVGFGKLPLIDH